MGFLDTLGGTTNQNSSGGFLGSLGTPAPTQPKQSLSDQIWGGIAGASDFLTKNNFPGAQLGQAVGNSVGGLIGAGGAALNGDFKTAGDVLNSTAQQNNANYGKVVGDTIQSVTLPASLAIGGGTGATLASRAGNAALKYGLSGAATSGGASLAGGGTASEALKSAVVGGTTGAVLGGGTQLAGEGLSALVNNLPNRLARQALPKLGQGNEEYALANTKVGSVTSLLGDSNSSVSNLGKQVQTILTHPDYIGETGAGDFAISKTMNAFPNSEYTPEKIIATIKNLVPAQAKIVDGIADGTANLQQKNLLRSALDNIVKKAFTDSPDLTANKEIGLQFSNALRGEVQSFAPETQPVFANLTKEINLQDALQSKSKQLATKSALGLYDIIAALGGFTTGGPVGTGIALGLEKAARSPAVGLAAAKGLSASTPALMAGGRALTNVAIPQISKAVSQP